MSDKQKPNYKVLVEMEIFVDGDEYAADDTVHEVWEKGDPDDATNATIYVKDVEPIGDAHDASHGD